MMKTKTLKQKLELIQDKIEAGTFKVLKHVPAFRGIYAELINLINSVYYLTEAITALSERVIVLEQALIDQKEMNSLLLKKLNGNSINLDFPKSGQQNDKPN